MKRSPRISTPTKLDFREQFPASRRRSGFTLIEILVAVGLLVLIMSIFVNVFVTSTNTMKVQQAIGENNQRARIAFTVIDGDLKKMSYRAIPGEGGITPLIPSMTFQSGNAHQNQRGYFYYSENDPNNLADDVLRFTVDTGSNHFRNLDEENYFGRATNYFSGAAAVAQSDQPDWDDGIPNNDTGASPLAEITYFLRHGRLYRRVSMLRVPRSEQQIPADNTTADEIAQPELLNGNDPMATYTDNFHTDFDYSAHHATDLGYAHFHGTLSNEFGSGNSYPLGDPAHRFGHYHDDLSDPGDGKDRGRPMEYIYNGTMPSALTDFHFIGSFTQLETSSLGQGADNNFFGYPQRDRPIETLLQVEANNGFNLINLTEFDDTGVISRFDSRDDASPTDTSRQGVDILLANVVAFDVKAWDETAVAWVNIGNSDAVNGDYDSGDRRNTEYGPFADDLPQFNNIYDTWHSELTEANNKLTGEAEGTSPNQVSQPPFRPLRVNVGVYEDYDGNDPSSNTDNFDGELDAGEDADGDGELDLAARRWTVDLVVKVGDIILPSSQVSAITDAIAYEVASVPGYDLDNSGSVDTAIEQLLGKTGANEPNWTANPRDYDPSATRSATPSDGITYQPVLNLKPLKAIQIQIHFKDPNSGTLRQVSFVHSLAQ